MTATTPTDRDIVCAYFDGDGMALQPDADVALERALRVPRRYSWSYQLHSDWYTCRSWDEVLEVAGARN